MSDSAYRFVSQCLEKADAHDLKFVSGNLNTNASSNHTYDAGVYQRPSEGEACVLGAGLVGLSWYAGQRVYAPDLPMTLLDAELYRFTNGEYIDASPIYCGFDDGMADARLGKHQLNGDESDLYRAGYFAAVLIHMFAPQRVSARELAKSRW